jgi:hypothetical protein
MYHSSAGCVFNSLSRVGWQSTRRLSCASQIQEYNTSHLLSTSTSTKDDTVEKIQYIWVQRYTRLEAIQKFSQNNVCIAEIAKKEGGLYFEVSAGVGY